MLKEEKEKMEIINEEIIPERLTCCPECKEKGMVSSIKRLQYEENRYWVCCTRRDECSFLEEYEGKAVITKEDLIIYGLPGQLAEHMDIFYEDINKIVRLCMSEYIKMRYLASPTTDFDFKGFEGSVNISAERHGLADFGQLYKSIKTDECDLRALEDMVKVTADPQVLQGFSQPSPTSKTHECDMSMEEEFVRTLAGFHEVNGSNELTKTNARELIAVEVPVGTIASFEDLGSSLSTIKTESNLAGNEDLESMLQSYLFSPLSQPTNMLSGDLPFKNDEKNKCLHSLNNYKQNYQSSKCSGLYYSMRKLAESLVADLSFLYQEKVKTAFSKIEGYNFPEDFSNMTALDKLPLFKTLQERERQERIKTEVDEQLKDFTAEIDGIKELLQ